MSWFGSVLPLLGKELLEQAARRRTYVVRVLYAVLLYLVAGMSYAKLIFSSGTTSLGALGRGDEFYEQLIILQFFGIFLFMPALASGAIAGEKERDSLVLLMLTRLRPTTIVLEKYLSRIIPMLMFLLLCLPLLTIAYSMGGLTQAYLWSGVILLVVTALQVGSVAILCSAYFRTSVGAFIGSYLVGLFYMAGPVVLCVWIDATFPGFRLPHMPLSPTLGLLSLRGTAVLGPGMFLPLTLRGSAEAGDLVGVVCGCGPTLVSSAFFLILARWCLVRRAFIQPRNLVIHLFHALDRLFRRWNENWLTRGIVLVPESAELPGTQPVKWREVNKSAFGSFRYLVRLFIVAEVPVFFVCTLIAIAGGDVDVEDYLAFVLFVVWIVVVLIVSVKASSIINVERTRQTLDVLLTMPMTGREIVQQKMQGVWRLCSVLSIPLFTVIGFKTWWINGTDDYGHRWRDADVAYLAPVYLLCSVLSVVVYLPLSAWLSAWFGVWMRHQARATFVSLALIVAWCIIPVFLFMAVVPPGPMAGNLLCYFSPMVIIPVNEFHAMREVLGPSPPDGKWLFGVLALILTNFLIYALFAFLWRHLALRNVDYFVGRLETRTRHSDSDRVGSMDLGPRFESMTRSAEMT